MYKEDINVTLPAQNPSVEASLPQRFSATRAWTARLCEPLRTEDYVVQPVVDVSPPKWHLAHTTWFFEIFILTRFKADYQVFDKDFNYVFNSYYESMGEKMLRNHRGNMTRPTTEEIYRYRNYVDEHMLALMQSPAMQDTPQISELVELGIHHEQQHQELLVTDIKFILGNNPLFPVYREKKNSVYQSAADLSKQTYIAIPEGNYTIGYEGDGFHFDNEKGVHKVFLHNYRILNRLITNEEYLAFMEDGGYDHYDLWLADGRDFILQHNIKAPAYWHHSNGHWYHFTLHGLQPVDLKAPVTHVSYYEADAFARWSGKRLPTEFEWETACKIAGHDRHQNNGAGANVMETSNFQPVALTSGPSADQVAQMVGDVWEWTQSAYLPYPYYQRVRGALGEYNGKFMVNQMVLRGGSCATPASHIRMTYRNFFQPDKRWQFTGIRLAENF